MSGLAVDPDKICTATGLGLTEAQRGTAWRITKDAYVQTSGITGVLVNDRVGLPPSGTPDRHGRYDTQGRTVYFADTAKTALAEVLQHLRVKVVSLAKDAAAVGMDTTQDYRQALTEDLHNRGLPGPGEVSVDWQLAISLYEVQLPATGWWVVIDCPATLNALSNTMGGSVPQLTLEHVIGDNRALITQPAQVVHESVLEDGSLPLGIVFPSKTAYGRCWAWWNRRADDNFNPGSNEAVELANDTDYGLAASVFTRDIGRASRMANQLDAGTVWINYYLLYGPDLPMSGFKQSGLGTESSTLGVAEYSRVKHVAIDLDGPVSRV